jgi:hypothetical protein
MHLAGVAAVALTVNIRLFPALLLHFTDFIISIVEQVTIQCNHDNLPVDKHDFDFSMFAQVLRPTVLGLGPRFVFG